MMALISQYAEVPGESSTQSDPNDDGSKNVTKIIYAAIGIVALLVIYFVFFSGGSRSTEGYLSEDTQTPSGLDNLAEAAVEKPAKADASADCGASKNCFDNPSVCKCMADEYCSNETKQCAKPVCGNGNCEPNEYKDTCCDDCGCVDGGCQICNSSSHTCYGQESKISDGQAISAVESYLQDKGLMAEAITVKNSVCSGSKVLKYVLANVSDSKILQEFSVSESMVVTPSPRV